MSSASVTATFRRRVVLGLVPVGMGAAFPSIGWAQNESFPSKPVTLVVPFPPGGATDYVARTLSQRLAALWKVPVIVENKSGAAGNLAGDFVARGPADGHTILLGAVSIVTNPPIYKKPSYVPQQLVPIGVGVTSSLVTITRPDLGVTDATSLLKLATSKMLNAASAGAGTLSHLGLELMAAHQKVRLNHIHYRGSAPALNDLIAGQVDFMIDAVSSSASHISAGKVKAVAVHSPRRNRLLQSVPTFAEAGLDALTFDAWNIFCVPAATPKNRISALHAGMSKIVSDAEVISALNDRGLEVLVQTPEESLRFVQKEAVRWGRVITSANVTL